MDHYFYWYGGHTEFIKLMEYYGMPRVHSLSIFAHFLGEKKTSRYISQEKGNHYYIQTQQNYLVFLITIFF